MIQHYLYTIFNPYNWGPNISAEIVQIVVVGAVVLIFRKPSMRLYNKLKHHAYGQHLLAMEERIREDIHGHHEDSVEVLKAHVTAELLAQDKRLAVLVKPTPKAKGEV